MATYCLVLPWLLPRTVMTAIIIMAITASSWHSPGLCLVLSLSWLLLPCPVIQLATASSCHCHGHCLILVSCCLPSPAACVPPPALQLLQPLTLSEEGFELLLDDIARSEGVHIYEAVEIGPGLGSGEVGLTII